MIKVILRAWLPEYELMVFSDDQASIEDLTESWNIDSVEIQETYFSNPDGEEMSRYIEPKQIVMMYTGLEDKYGERIFEGDKITNPEGKTSTIVWFECGFYSEFTTNRGIVQLTALTSGFVKNKTNSGNIYQNL